MIIVYFSPMLNNKIDYKDIQPKYITAIVLFSTLDEYKNKYINFFTQNMVLTKTFRTKSLYLFYNLLYDPF